MPENNTEIREGSPLGMGSTATPLRDADAGRHTAAELRLRRHADFQRVYNSTKKQHSKQMSYFAARRDATASGEGAPGPHLPGTVAEVFGGPRIGLTVGKVMGKAHTRNRIKRRLREAVRAEHAVLAGLPVDVVLHPRRTVETLPFVELRAEIAAVFRRVSRTAGAMQQGAREQESRPTSAVRPNPAVQVDSNLLNGDPRR